MTDRPPVPSPMRCPACGEETGWEWDDDDRLPTDPPDYVPRPEWVIAGEWWHDRDHGIEYADSRRCLVRLQRAAGADVGAR